MRGVDALCNRRVYFQIHIQSTYYAAIFNINGDTPFCMESVTVICKYSQFAAGLARNLMQGVTSCSILIVIHFNCHFSHCVLSNHNSDATTTCSISQLHKLHFWFYRTHYKTKKKKQKKCCITCHSSRKRSTATSPGPWTCRSLAHRCTQLWKHAGLWCEWAPGSDADDTTTYKRLTFTFGFLCPNASLGYRCSNLNHLNIVKTE